MIPGSANPLLLKSAAAAAGGYQVSRSLRFNSSDSAYLSRTPAVAGDRRTWTWAGWMKRSNPSPSNSETLFTGLGGGVGTTCEVTASGQIEIYTYSGGYVYRKVSTALYRDFSAWYHFQLVYDTGNATADDRILFYVNGVRITSWSTNTTPSQNYEGVVNQSGTPVFMGGGVGSGGYYFTGYLADIHFIDGQALTPSSFTEVSATTGQLIPKAYSGGSYGTNGFYLQFADNSSNTATTLGKDTSGNSNNWTPNNFQATVQTGRLYGQASGTSTSAFSSANFIGNFPTPVATGLAIFDADLITSVTSATFSYIAAFSSLVEVLVSADGTNWTSKGNQSSAYTTVTNATAFRYVRWFYSTFGFGISNNPGGNDSLVDTPTSYGTDTGVGGEVRGNYCTANPLAQANHTLSNGNLDVLCGSSDGVCQSTIGMSSGKWYCEWTSQGSPSEPYGNTNKSTVGLSKSGVNLSSYLGADANGWSYYSLSGNKTTNGSSVSYGATYVSGDIIGIAFDADNGTLVFYKNGVSQGTAYTGLTSGPYFFSTGSSFVKGIFNFGQRAFAYQTPGTNRPAATFLALCDTNLGAPLVAKPNTLMDVKLYTATDGVSGSVSGVNFSPDLVWVKSRAVARSNVLMDTVRGTSSVLWSDLTDAQLSSSQYVSQFNSDGFNYGAAGDVSNGSTVAWLWDAGTTTDPSNTAGSITSQVRANASAGFSIVKYPNVGSTNSTIGHGLGVAPKLVIVRYINQGSGWYTYHADTGAGKYLELQSTNSAATLSSMWNNTAPTSTVFSVGTAWTSSIDTLAYCFAPVVGYSSFGSYTGNGSSDGPFVYTGFRPKWILYKRTDTTGFWLLADALRNGFNPDNNTLCPNLSDAEDSTDVLDILSNGFKLRVTGPSSNASGGTYIFAAFAENPFQYARAR